MPWQLFKDYGLLGLVVGGNIFLLFLVVKWTLATTRDILNQAAKERESWVKALTDHTIQAQRFHDSITEAHNYQRQEHQKLAENQANGSQSIALVCQALGQVESALGRINGYVKEK